MTIGNWDAWNFRSESGEAWPLMARLIGFRVHATDGEIGKITDASTEENASWIVVDTGPWIFGHQVVLPAGTIQRVDWEHRAVGVDLSKDEVADAPPPETEFGSVQDEEYRGQLGTYYGTVVTSR